MSKKLFIILLLIALIFATGVLFYRGTINFYSLGNYPERDKVCRDKNIIWDKGTYLIDKNPSDGKIVLKVEKRNADTWSDTLKPITREHLEQFKTCVKGITKLPEHVENDPVAGKEIKGRSKGLEVSIGIQKPFTYKPIANITLSVELYASKFSNEPYNLDVALQNIAENYKLTRDTNNNWHLNFNAPLEDKFDMQLPFYYQFVRLNGKELDAEANVVEFISKDEGKTWEPVLSNNRNKTSSERYIAEFNCFKLAGDYSYFTNVQLTTNHTNIDVELPPNLENRIKQSQQKLKTSVN